MQMKKTIRRRLFQLSINVGGTACSGSGGGVNTGWILHVFIYFYFYFWLHFKGNLSYLTRDWIHAPFSGSLESTE